jgi:hypothetical protein
MQFRNVKSGNGIHKFPIELQFINAVPKYQTAVESSILNAVPKCSSIYNAIPKRNFWKWNP